MITEKKKFFRNDFLTCDRGINFDFLRFLEPFWWFFKRKFI